MGNGKEMRANTDHLPPSLTRAVKLVKETDRQIGRQSVRDAASAVQPLDRRRITARAFPACCVV